MFNSKTDIWSGVFSSRDEAWSQVSESGHVESEWLSKSLDRLNLASDGIPIAQERELPEWSYPLEAIVALAAIGKNSDSAVNVIDVGGNLGQLGLLCQRVLIGRNLNWSVLELPEFLERIPPELIEGQICNYFSEMPETTVDFLVMGSVFQYFEEPFDHLAKIVSRGSPRFIGIFDAMVSAEITTFTSIQAYFESSMVCTFYSIKDVNEIMSALGFELLTMRPLITARSSLYFPQESLPDGYRIPYPLNLIYERAEKN